MADNKGNSDNTQRSVVNKDFMAGLESGAPSIDTMLLNIKHAEKATLISEEAIAKARELHDDEYYKKKEQHIKDSQMSEADKEAALKKLRDNRERDAFDLAKKLEGNLFKMSSNHQRVAIIEKKKATAANYLEELKLQKAKIASMTTEEMHGVEKNSKLRELRKLEIQTGKEAVKLEKQQRAVKIAALKDQKKNGIITQDSLNAQLESIKESYALEREQHEANIANIDAEIAALEEKRAAGDYEDEGEIDSEIASLKQDKEEEKEALKQDDKDRFKGELLANTMKAGFGSVSKGLNNMAGAFNDAVNKAIDSVGQYKSFIDAALQGTQSSYDDVSKTMKKALAISPWVKQEEVLKKLNDAVDKGIAYNVEQRAFLATMTDKIVHTFDAFDSNLMRIIRLQQADTTAARMGMEANLLQFFNSTFSDNSYLTEGYDNVSQALVDANAQMTRDMSISFEFNVQKWMGSLASLGFGTDTIQTIAEGINHLGSGNVAALAGNTQLQSLLAMSASRAGLSYSELLVKGIDDSSVNTLLKSMVEYLKEIAEDDNAVVKAAYGDVFNFKQADLRAIKNLTEGDIANIANQSMSYSQAMAETQSQLLKVTSRLSMNEMIDNIWGNFLYSTGESIASNPVTALLYKTIDLVESVTGGIELPFLNVSGFGLNLNMSIESLLKTGIFGLSALGQVGNMVSSLGSGGGLDLGIWGGTEYTKRGGDFQSTVGGVQSSTSGSKSVTSSSSSDSKEAAISSTEEDQESQKKKSKESMSEEITLETLYKELFEKKSAVYVLSNPIEERLTQLTAVELAKKTTVDNIHKLMRNKEDPMYVIVKNLPPTLATLDVNALLPKSSVGITNVKEVANAIGEALLGKSDDSGSYVDGKATLGDIANILLNGTIQVIDRATQDEIKNLSKDFY